MLIHRARKPVALLLCRTLTLGLLELSVIAGTQNDDQSQPQQTQQKPTEFILQSYSLIPIEMPISQPPDHHPLEATLSMSYRAAQFFHEIDDALPLLKRRNAINTKEKVLNIAHHKMTPTLMNQFTTCSQCKELIWVYGLSCKQCNLVSHRRCDRLIQIPCTRSTVLDDQDVVSGRVPHKFKDTYFCWPKSCDHCGTVLTGVASKQGARCISCGMAVHFECRALTWECHGKPLENEEFDLVSRVGAFLKGFISKQDAGCTSCRLKLTGKCNCKPRGTLEESFDKSLSLDDHERQKISIKDFDILQILGVGSFSKVYLGMLRNEGLLDVGNGKFAIKVINKANTEVSCNPDSIMTEMRTLNLGRQCPFLTIAHCCFQTKSRLFFVMEYLVGRDLLYHIRKSRKFTEDRARFYAAEVVLALMFLHKRCLVYRDVKLDNVILDRHGHCKLTDFGMAKNLTSIGETRTFCGTPSYMAPEMIQEKSYNYSVDWWSLGVMMYEMMVGCSPFDAEFEDEVYKKILYEPINLSQVPSSEAKLVLEDFLNKEPEKRLGNRLASMNECHSEIKRHPFFMCKVNKHPETHWEDIELKRISPPYKPTIEDINDYDEEEQKCNFEGFNLTSGHEETFNNIGQCDFKGFSFYSESFKLLANLNE